MDERMKFITRLQEGEKISHLCAEFGIEFSCLFVFLAKAGIQREPENSNGIGISPSALQIYKAFKKKCPTRPYLLN